MNIKSKTTSVFVLGIASLVLSRLAFFFVNDPEGPNMFVILGLAIIIFIVLFAVYSWGTKSVTKSNS